MKPAAGQMTELGRGSLGSLRRRVEHEIWRHKRDNPIMRRTRYPLAAQLLRLFLTNHSFSRFVAVYTTVAVSLAVAEALIPQTLLPGWTEDSIKGFLKDAAGYLITAQVGILGVVSMAVGLVTLIAQRDDRSSTNTDIRLYYSEALAYEVVASSAALLVVLSVQIFWPLQFAIHAIGLGSADLFFKALLTFLHVVWLSMNIAAFAQFLATSLRFVEPKAREGMRERYTANLVIPDDLRRRLLRTFCMLAPKHLIAEADTDNGPHVMVGHDWLDSGAIELQRDFTRPMVLRDIRLRPLGFVLRSWWRRTVESGRPNSRPGPAARVGQTTFAVPPSFDRIFEGVSILCRQTGGVPLSGWERRLLRFSFRFAHPRKASDTDLPNPSGFLEELADKVIGQIERLAITGFKTALDEMVRYHSFLIAAYNSRDDNGLPLSLAEFGGIWESPLQEWIHQYRRIFERAVDKLSDDPAIVERMAHVPYRLLAEKPAEVSKTVDTSILDLGSHLVVMLENWVTRRTSVDAAAEGEAQPRLALAGTDRRAYDRALLGFAGAWENVLRFSETRFQRRDISPPTTDVQWKRRTASWPFLERHLGNSAYYLALAVWNEDELGAERFRDVLLRWLDTFKGDLRPDYFVRHQVLLTPQIFQLDWSAVESRLVPFSQGAHHHPDPNSLFCSIVRRTFDDFVLVTAAVTLAWYMNKQQASPIGGDTARLLITRQVIPGDGTQRAGHVGRPQTTFDWVLGTILRADLSEDMIEGTYRGSLDGVVLLLDKMTERRVVPGRIYSSWGRDGLTTLTLPLLAFLLTSLPAEPDEAITRKVCELTASDEFFGDGDASLRRIVSTVADLKSALTDPPNQVILERGIRKLSPEIHLANVVQRLATLLDTMALAIEAQRTQHLLDWPVDQAKLEAFRRAFEDAMDGLKNVNPFDHFNLRRGTAASGALQEWSCSGVDKGQLTTPPLAWPQSDLANSLAEWFQESLVSRIWVSFGQRPKQIIRMPAAGYPDEFWRLVGEQAAPVEGKPVLVVPYDPIGENLSNWLYARAAERPAGLRIDYLSGRGNGGGIAYEATVNGIDVFCAQQMPRDRALLFSDKALRSIEHMTVAADGHIAEVTLDEGKDPRKSIIRVRFDQWVEWDNSLIFEFVLEDVAAADEDDIEPEDPLDVEQP
jgi:hypothetical protein